MPVTFIDSQTRDLAGGLAITFDMSTITHATDDFLIAFVKQSENTTQRVWDDDGGGGNGWTRLAYNRFTSGRDQETAIYYKIATSASEANPTFTWATGVTTEPMSGSLLVYRGVDLATPINAFGYSANQNDPNPPNPSANVSNANSAVLCFHAATHDDITTPAPPTGFTMRSQVWNGTNDDHRNHFTADILDFDTLGLYTPPDWQHSVLNTTPEYHTYTVVLNEVQAIGIISAPASSTYGSTITLTGFGFKAVQGVGKVELWDDLTGTTKVVQTVNSWSDTSIEIDLTQGALGNDNLFYLVVTNSDLEESSPRAISLGIEPYFSIISNTGVGGPDHHWPLNGNYDDIVGGNDMIVSPVNGGGTFVSTAISEGTTNSWRCQSSRREAPNSHQMNRQTEVNPLMGGWIRLQTTQQGLACLYEEGGGVNNLAFFTGLGNVLIAQQADTNDDNVQAFSDIKLTEGRDYHILFRFSYTDVIKEFRMYLDGALQQVTSGNPLTATDLDGHSGDISFGGPGGNLEVAGTDVLFASAEDCLYSNWVTWDESIGDADILQLFRRGAVPTVTIASDTQANMQAALDLLTGVERPDAPLAIRVEDVLVRGNLALDADDIVFNARCTIFVEWHGASRGYSDVEEP